MGLTDLQAKVNALTSAATPQERLEALESAMREVLSLPTVAFSKTTAAFTQAAVDETITVQVTDAGWMVVGMFLRIGTGTTLFIGGTFQITQILSEQSIRVKLREADDNSGFGTSIPAGSIVTVSGSANTLSPFPVQPRLSYVDNKVGSNTFDGSFFRPYQTIQAAMNAASSHNPPLIVVRFGNGGVYAENINVPNKGTASSVRVYLEPLVQVSGKWSADNKDSKLFLYGSQANLLTNSGTEEVFFSTLGSWIMADLTVLQTGTATAMEFDIGTHTPTLDFTRLHVITSGPSSAKGIRSNHDFSIRDCRIDVAANLGDPIQGNGPIVVTARGVNTLNETTENVTWEGTGGVMIKDEGDGDGEIRIAGTRQHANGAIKVTGGVAVQTTHISPGTFVKITQLNEYVSGASRGFTVDYTTTFDLIPDDDGQLRIVFSGVFTGTDGSTYTLQIFEDAFPKTPVFTAKYTAANGPVPFSLELIEGVSAGDKLTVQVACDGASKDFTLVEGQFAAFRIGP